MDSVEEIEVAIDRLTPDDYRRVVEWFRAREDARWDEQMDQDNCSGKLDFLFRDADKEAAQGLLREWPSTK